MKRRWIALCLALMMLLSVFGAAQAVDLSTGNSLTVAPGGSDLAADLAKADVVLDLYYVATAVRESGYDSYWYSMNAGFTSLTISKNITNSGWASLAQQAAKLVFATGSTIKPTYTAQPVNTKLTNLPAGLYLVIARGRSLTTPDNNETTGYLSTAANGDIMTHARSVDFEYTFSPELVTLPGKTTGNTAGGSWIYDQVITLKPEQTDRKGSLEIVKQLTSYETQSPATFVFQVVATRGGEIVYDDIASFTFTEAGQKSVVIDDLPVGATVTVTEIYSGASYTLTTSPEQTALIEANKVVSVSFTNQYDEHERKGHGIQNHFEFQKNANGELTWNWKQE